MKKTKTTKVLAVFLTVLMLLSVAPFGELAGLDLGFKLQADAVSGYSAGGAVSADTNWAWNNMGKLWLPTEVEVFGHIVGTLL